MEYSQLIVDAVIVILIIVGMVCGIKRGFVKTVATPVKFVASIAFAFDVCDKISVNFIEPFIKSPLANQLRDFMYEKCNDLTAENVSTELPTLLKMSAGIFGVDVEEVAQSSVNGVLDSIINSLTDPIVHIVGVVVSFILAYIVAKIVLALIVVLINAILSVGPLGIINKALGFVFGSAFSVIIAWGLVVGAEFVMGFIGYGFDGGVIYEFFRGFNPLDLLLSF